MRKKRYYLAGPIADVKDDSYKTWREDLSDFLKSLGFKALNPLTKYKGKGGDVKDELFKMRKEGDWEGVKEFMEAFVLPADRELVKKSDGVIAYVPEYTVGTIREISLAYEWNKPVYIVTYLKLPSNSLIAMATKVFRTWDELKEYFRKTLK